MTIFNCITHGDWDSNKASGCPDCVAYMRRELRTLRNQLSKLISEYDRLLVLATKHCPKDHHDWPEIINYDTPEES